MTVFHKGYLRCRGCKQIFKIKKTFTETVVRKDSWGDRYYQRQAVTRCPRKDCCRKVTIKKLGAIYGDQLAMNIENDIAARGWC